MAEKIALDLLINSASSAKSVGELKQSIKDIKNAMVEVGETSPEFGRLASAAGKAQDKVDDLNDTITALNPGRIGSSFVALGSSIAGGFQAAQGAMALFGEAGEDVQKMLLRVQAATAFAQGIQQVKGLSDAFKNFDLVLKANIIFLISAVIIAIGVALYELKDRIPIVAKAFDFIGDQIEAVTSVLKKFGDMLGLTGESYDSLLEKAKKNVDQRKKWEEQHNLDLDKARQEREAKEKVAEEERLRSYKENLQKQFEAYMKHRIDMEQLDTLKNIAVKESTQEAVDEFQKIPEAAYEGLGKVEGTFLENLRANTQHWLDNNSDNLYASLGATANLFSQLEQLSDKNADSQKAFAISGAIINTSLGITKALAELPAPASFIAAAATAAAGLVQIRKITQTPKKSGSSGVEAPRITGSGGVNIQPLSTTTTQLPSDQIDKGQGKIQTVKAYVVESEMTSTQNKIKTIVNKSKIG